MNKSTHQLLKIGQVSEQTGIPASTLRYYENIGLIPPPQRISGQRHYHPDILPVLTIIQWAKSVGFTLDEIRNFRLQTSQATPLSHQWQTAVPDKMTAIDEEIDRLNQMKNRLQQGMACACVSLDMCELIACG